MKIQYIFLLLYLFITNVHGFEIKDNTARVIIPFGPGGGTDTVFRKLQKYGDQQGINLIPIYRPGANGMIGMQAVYDSLPDGMTFGVITFDTVTIFSTKALVDLSNIITIQKNTFGIVTNKNASLKELVSTISDKKPMKIGYLLFSQKAIMQSVLKAYGIKNEQVFVPYKAGSEMIQNAINGDIDVAITSLNVLAPLVKTGKLKLIATDASIAQHDFEDVPSLNILDSSISGINKGSSIVLPPNTDEAAKKFWQKFVQGYLADPQTKNDSKINYWEPVRRTTKELEKDLIENTTVLQ
jgi:tripartite-type tricarboxylate transporter receptor subunit TctC